MSEPRPEQAYHPRTEVAKLLADGLWERHAMAPDPDPAQIDEQRDALWAVKGPDDTRIQLIATVTKTKGVEGISVEVGVTGGTARKFSGQPEAALNFRSHAKTVREALSAVAKSMMAAGYTPDGVDSLGL